MHNVLEVAKYFIAKSIPGTPKAVTHLKLQKLVYYAQGFYLAVHNKPLFGERIEAWVHGPVCPSLYRLFNHYNYNEIDDMKIDIKNLNLDKDAIEILDFVWDNLGHLSGKELEELTHQEAPWLDAREGLDPYEISNNIIPLEHIHAYFVNEYLSGNSKSDNT
ncbi:type II toxin-antitoxin system antitoxin SocA domain-containing protein [Parageobacillus sp. KH3-4]|uniref:Panacea domain-containing protein n=1 Tax=Parageobacillus sp. KH3-4 TaxID=2916802 RepID=UPI001FCB2D6E|nr:type II toxin-antitoxin system antitoxin SocA domain-containing protein [Parageobacillus sp. KH3-4]BDG46395.1 hypothetical protein PspKH34_09560 [Parageobacillus sp. KH3-4]